jgi:hypothetical protein
MTLCLDQRFDTSQFGRFMSADRFKQAAKANDSGSWNKYSYANGDPVNRVDRRGTCDDEIDDSAQDSEGDGGGGGGDICSALGLVEAGGGNCDEPGGGDGSGGSTFTPCSNWGCMAEALQTALNDLKKPQCAGIFGTAQTRQSGCDPTNVIKQVYAYGGSQINGSFVVADFSIIPSLVNAAAATIPTPFGGAVVLIGSASWAAWNSGCFRPSTTCWVFPRN